MCLERVHVPGTALGSGNKEAKGATRLWPGEFTVSGGTAQLDPAVRGLRGESGSGRHKAGWLSLLGSLGPTLSPARRASSLCLSTKSRGPGLFSRCFLVVTCHPD